MQKKRLSFRLYIQILIFFALVGLGVLLLWPLRQAVQHGMISVRDGIIGRMEQRIDRQIFYSSISPSVFGAFDVRNVRIIGKDENAVLTVNRFRISYSLWELIRGKKLAIRSVRIDSPFIDLNTVRDQDIFRIFDSANNGKGASLQSLTSMLPDKLQLYIRNGRCLILSGGSQFELDALDCDARIVDKRMILDSGCELAFTAVSPLGSPVNVRLTIDADGSCSTDLEEGEAVISLFAVNGDITGDQPVSFDFALQDSVITLRKVSDMLPFDLLLGYGLNDESLVIKFTSVNLCLREFLSLSGGLEKADLLLDIAGSGSAFFMRETDGSIGYSVDLSGSTLSKNFPALTDGASFEIKAEGDGNEAHIGVISFSMPVVENSGGLFCGDVNFSGNIEMEPLAPAGTLSLGNFSLSGVEGVTADFTISTEEGEITAFCQSLNLGRVNINSFSAKVNPSESDIGFSVSAFTAGRKGSVSLEGLLNPETRRVEAGLAVGSFSVGDIMDMALPFTSDGLPPAAVRGLVRNTLLTTEVFLTAEAGHLSYNAPRFVFIDRGGRGLDGFVSLSGTDSRFQLREGRITWGDDTVMLTGLIEFSDSNNIVFSADSRYRNLRYEMNGRVLNGKSVTIQGSNGLNVVLNPAGRGGYSGLLRADGFPLPFLGKPALLSCDVRLNYSTETAWSVEFDRFEVADITSPTGLARFQISGRADQNGAAFPALLFRDSLGPLGGRADFSWGPGFSGLTGSVAVAGDRENYHIKGAFPGDSFDFALSGSSMRLERVLGRSFGGFVDGDIRFSLDSADSYRAELNLTSVNGRLSGREFNAKVRAVLDEKELSVNGLDVRYAGISVSVPEITVRGRDGTAGTSAEFRGLVGVNPVEGRLSFEAGFTPVQSWLDFEKAFDSFSGKAVVTGYKYGTGRPQDFDFVFSKNGGDLSVTGGPRDMLRLQVDGEGNFYAGLSSPFPVRGSAVGSVRNNTIDAHCGDLYVDLAGLFDILPLPEKSNIYLTGGYASASLDIRGSVADPEFYGTLRGNSVKMRIPEFIPQELRPIPFTAAVEGNEIHFGPVRAAVGNGAGTVSGWFRFDRWIPNILSLDIAVPRETPIPYGFEISGFIAKGDAYGNLNVSMEDMVMGVSGDLYANNTELSVNMEDVGTEAFADVKIPTVVNLNVTTGSAVEFFYPNTRFPLLRANPEMGTRLRVTADTAAQRFSLTSDINIRGGEIFYFERSFYIRSGTLTFRENELRFAPRLSARAEVRDRNEDGPVTISMIVTNEPLFSFTARFESTPALSQMEIFALMGQSLVGQNLTGTGSDENASNVPWAALSSATDLAMQFLFIRQLEQGVRSFTRLDMFSMRTQFVQNLLFTATGLMQAPVDRNIGVGNYLGNYLNNTTFFGGKYIGQDMFVQSMVSMRYDANRPDYWGLTVETDFGVELQSPLFNIRWNFVPTHPENWWVNDNAITLTRRWLF